MSVRPWTVGTGKKPIAFSTKPWILSGVLVVLLLGVPGAAVAGQECPAGLKPGTEVRLFFGLIDKEGKYVPEIAWQQFLADVITPRFRHGLTVFDAKGQWLAPSGKLLRDPVKMVLIAEWLDRAKTMKLVEEISAAYTKQFNQHSVFRMTSPICAG